MDDTIFTKIINKELPAQFEYEDDKCVVIHDKFPKSKFHLLIIPRKPIPTIMDVSDEDQELLGHMMLVARDVGRKLGLTGYKLVYNVGRDGGQEIMHIHLHLLG